MASISEEFGYIIGALKKKIMLISGIVIAGMLLSFSSLKNTSTYFTYTHPDLY